MLCRAVLDLSADTRHTLSFKNVTVGCFDLDASKQNQNNNNPSTICYTLSSTTAKTRIAFKPIASNALQYPSIESTAHINHLLAAKLMPRSHPHGSIDHLIIATDTSLWMYNVYENSDIAYIDVPLGVKSVAVATDRKVPIVFAALGDFLIQGYNYKGEEVFWTMTGDIPVSIAVCTRPNPEGAHEQLQSSESFEMLVASEDAQVRHYKNDEIVQDVQMSSVVSAVLPVQGNGFGFMTQDVSVGIHSDFTKLAWRHSGPGISCFSVCSAADSDSTAMSECAVFVGYANGRVEMRDAGSGKVVWTEILDETSGVATILNTGTNGLAVVLANGKVHLLSRLSEKTLDLSGSCHEIEEQIEAAFERRQALLSKDTRTLKQQANFVEERGDSFSVDIKTTVSDEPSQPSGCFLHLESVSRNQLIHAVVVHYQNQKNLSESKLVEPPKSTASILLDTGHDATAFIDTRIQILYTEETKIPTRTDSQQRDLQVSVCSLRLSPFSKLAPIPFGSNVDVPELMIKFQHVSKSSSEYIAWLNESFPHPLPSYSKPDYIQTAFLDTTSPLYPPLIISFHAPTQIIAIRTMDVELATRILNSYVSWFTVKNKAALRVKTNGKFGNATMASLKDWMDRIQDLKRAVREGKNEMNFGAGGDELRNLQMHQNMSLEIDDLVGFQRDTVALFELHGKMQFEYSKNAVHDKQLRENQGKLSGMVQKLASLHLDKGVLFVGAAKEKASGDDVEALLEMLK
ncbi:Bardet-Biedl syndrome 2 protein [Chytriomyces hyalinus]|nr:Bardet-Biedl syndrome 2 protein [Chytriomyces hyalinus]